MLFHLLEVTPCRPNGSTLAACYSLLSVYQAIHSKTEVCIPYLGYAPFNSRVMKFIPLELQGAYPRYGIHLFLLCNVGINA